MSEQTGDCLRPHDRLLLAYLGEESLTDLQAHKLAGLQLRGTTNRCHDLRCWKYLDWDWQETADPTFMEKVFVNDGAAIPKALCHLTETGLKAAQDLQQKVKQLRLFKSEKVEE